MFAFNRLFMPFLGLTTRVVYICMKVGLPYAYTNVGLRKSFFCCTKSLSRKKSQHQLKRCEYKLLDKLEFIDLYIR